MKDILKITVTIGGRTVGTIQMTPERDRSVFEYDKDWISDGFSISPLEIRLADAIRAKRVVELRNGEYGFKDESTISR
ncbi:MAG: HipA N-terminal domain-containing protein [Candidatus Cryptobacteroides sp.]